MRNVREDTQAFMHIKAFIPISVHKGHLLGKCDRMRRKSKAMKVRLSFVTDHCTNRLFTKDLRRGQGLQ